jgi:hypothetical protein
LSRQQLFTQAKDSCSLTTQTRPKGSSKLCTSNQNPISYSKSSKHARTNHSICYSGRSALEDKGRCCCCESCENCSRRTTSGLHAGAIANFASAHAATIATITGGVAVGVILGEIAEILAKAVVAKKMSEQEAKTSFEKAKTLSPEGQKKFKAKLQNLLDEDFD